MLYFQRRDVILLAGSLLFIIGLAPFIPPIYAIAIGASIFFGIKAFAISKNRSIQRDAGEGFCAKCGHQIVDNTCLNCQ